MDFRERNILLDLFSYRKIFWIAFGGKDVPKVDSCNDFGADEIFFPLSCLFKFEVTDFS